MFGASSGSGTLPPLPKIAGDVDLMLDVYTHPSLRNSSNSSIMTNEEYGDTSRLAELGSKVLELAVSYHLYSEKPFLESDKIRERRHNILSDSTINDWLNAYGLKSKLRISPTDQFILEDPQQMRTYFHTYIGALYIRNGYPAIQAWISQLIDPNVEVNLPAPSPPVDQYQASTPQVPQTHYPSQPVLGGYAPTQTTSSMYPPPPPPSFPPPPLPTAPPTAPSSMSLVTLALVNQTAAQRGYQVTYPATQEGPSHQPTWTVRCCFNGKECGIGVGKSQKIAKEVAARQAWTTMGWGPS